MAKDVDDFVTKALGLSFDTLQVPVSSLPDYFDAFTRALRETGAGSDELTKRLCSGGDLRAICFRCSSWVDTPRIGMLSACRAMGRGSISVQEHGWQRVCARMLPARRRRPF